MFNKLSRVEQETRIVTSLHILKPVIRVSRNCACPEPAGCLHTLQVLLCLLVLICAGASHATLAGFSSGVTSTSFGTSVGGSAFEGKDLQRVQELDQAFNMKRAPALYGAIGVTLGLGMITLGVLVGSAR